MRGDRLDLKGAVVVFVTAGYSGKKFIFEKAKELGVRSIVIDSPDSWSAELVREGLIEQFVALDMSATMEVLFNKCLDAIKTVRQTLGALDGVVTFSEMVMPLATRLCAALDLPGNPPSAVDAARDKHATRKRMAEAGLPSPKNFLIQHAFQLDEAAKMVGFPAVIKPIYGAASIGVIRVDDEESLAASYARVVRELASARVISGALQQGDEEAHEPDENLEGSAASSWIRTTVMMEEYLDGPEVDVDLVFQDGKVLFSAIADNWPTVEPYFNETGSNAPSVLPLSQQQEMIALSVESVLCLGFHMGVFHVECKYTSRGPRLIEVNCRMGGGPVRYINLLVWGVDLVVEQLLCSVGVHHQLSIASKPLTALAEFSVNAMKTGILRDINFLKSYENRKDVLYARALVKPGAKLVCAADGLPTWVCELMVTRPTVEEAIDAIKAIEADIQQTMIIDSITPRVKLNTREYSVPEVPETKQSQKSLRGAVIVFITSGLSSKRFIFERAKALGVRSVVIDTSDSWSKALAKEGIIERFVSLDMISTEKLFERCLEAVQTIRRDLDQVDGVVTFSEIAMPLVTRLCSALGLPANSPKSVDLARNKYTTRKAMVQAGLPSPRHMLIENPFQLEAAAQKVGFPAVVKPISGAASIGVIRVDSLEALQAAYTRVVVELNSARVVHGALQQGLDEDVLGNASAWICTMVMLEEYLDGPEVDVDLVFSDGQPVFKAIADNWPTMEPYFLETGSNSPSILPTTQQREIIDLALRSIQCIGLQMGVFHVECKYTSNGPRLIEINCRMGGGPIHRINSEVWGVDLVEQQLNAVIGIEMTPKASIKPLRCVAEFSVNAMKTGILRDLNFLNICKNRKDVLYARPLALPGSRVVSVADGLPTWVCELMVSRPTIQEAIECVKAIVYDIQVATVIDRIIPRVKLNVKEQKSRL